MDLLQAKEPSDAPSDRAKTLSIPEGMPVRVEYFSRDIALPSDFLSPTGPAPPDARPMTLTPIDWNATGNNENNNNAAATLPENEGRYAAVLEHVLSPSECQTLLRLAEASVDLERANAFWTAAAGSASGSGPEGWEENPWRPAMVNAGAGTEVLDTWYRNSDRIVWDCQEVADRLWARCMRGEVGERLRETLGVLDGVRDEKVVGPVRRAKLWNQPPQRWEMRKLNKRLRFLKYGPGQFFKREFSSLSPLSPPRSPNVPSPLNHGWLTVS